MKMSFNSLRCIQNKIKFCLLILILNCFVHINAQQLAFPTAMGAGAYSTGGRGGEVVHVTNLNDSGTGSLRWALTHSSNKSVSRTIVFDVSGIINLQSDIYASNGAGDEGGYADGITIAGQTAPEGGITITGGKIFLVAIDDVVVRYIKFRSTRNVDGCLQSQDANNIMYDHLSGSHVESAEVTFSIVSNSSELLTTGKTIQNCLVSNSGLGFILGDTTPPNNTHNEEYSIINNLFVNVGHRAPGKIGGAVRLDVINNAVHNWITRLIRIDDWDYTLNHIGNYYSKGGRSTNLANTAYFGTNNGLIYDNDNYLDPGYSGHAWTDFDQPRVDPLPASQFVDTPFGYNNPETLNILPHINLKTEVLPYVGAYKYIDNNGLVTENRDEIDSSAINQAITEDLTQTSSNISYAITLPQIPTENNSRPDNFYQSNAHIPEAYLESRGIVGNASIHNETQPSGYTLLEEYINQVDGELITAESVSITPDTDTLTVPEALSLLIFFSPSNTTDQSGIWSSSNPSVASVDQNGLVNSISAGEVVITFTSNDGAFSNSSLITVLPEPFEASAGEDQEICVGQTVTLTASASNGENFLWDNGETTASIEVTPETTTIYTVIVSDGEGNSDEDSVVVTVNEVPVADAGEDQTICEGDTIIITASGGDTYLWSTGETTATIEVNPTEDTAFNVEVTSNNCSSTDEVIVFVNASPSLTVTNDVVIVEGDSTILTASDSDNYLWSTDEVTSSISVSPIATTIYTVETTTASGCVTSETVTVTVVPEVIANAGVDVSICFGDTITLTASGGSTYFWDTGSTGAELSVSPTETTTYTVTVEDDYDFTDSDEITVLVNELPSITASEDVFVMLGNTATLTVDGGESYEWSTGETTPEIFVSPEVTTTYSVVSTGVNGCESINEIIVTVVDILSANAGNDVSICLGESVTLNGSGGITFTWNNGDVGPNPNVTPSETTTYTVTVTDGFGNSDSDDVTVTVNPIPVADVSEDQVICEGESITLTANGGDTYFWNTGETTSSITVSPNQDSIYSVEVISNSCSDVAEISVTVLPTPNLVLSEDVVIVTGNSTILEVSGGDSYLWSTGDSNQSVEVSPTETTIYSVTAFSLNGCETSESISVTVVPEVSADAGPDVSICFGESITLTASGSQNYLWSTGETSPTITLNPTETSEYTVTVSDNFGNSDTDSIIITVNDLPTLTVSENIMIIEGETTELAVNGAASYLWSTGETTNVISVSPTETITYSVTGFSENGCETQEEVTITVIPQVIADAGPDVSICLGESITLTALGSQNYVWSTGETSPSITLNPTETSEYTVTVSDNFGNSDTDSILITVNDLPTLTVSENIMIIEGETTELAVNGAASYLWSTGETTNVISVSPTETITYNVTGFSENGCETQEEVTVTVIPQVIADAGPDVSICLGEIVTLNASGGVTYAWDNGGTSATRTFIPNETTIYTVTAFDEYGNSDSDSVTVTVNPLPVINVSDNITIIEGESTTLSVNGAQNYIWNTGETSNTILVTPSVTTTYSVTGITNGCSSETVQITVIVEPLFIASAGVDERVCDNQTTEVVLTANDGDSYLWSTGETTQSITVSPLSTASYTVTVTNNGQEDNDDVIVYVDPSPEVVISNGDSIDILSGDFVTLSASGANSYQWDNGATQPNIAVSPSVTTVYEVTGFIGECFDEKAVVINVYEPVEAYAGEDVIICLDDVTTLTATGGDEYVWSTGETTQSIQVSPSETTDYTVTVFNPLDFDEATVTVEIENNCEGQTVINPIGIPRDFDFDIYPNPASDILNIKYSGVFEVSDVHIYEVTGKLIKRVQVSNENVSLSATQQIDISSLQSGVYFIKLIGEEKDIIEKLIVK
ncbi:MAG: T9SS type A sorting domain-containing protein [Winogradskyella sp.]|uniref:T9SS type A sorting domain-containing protein n=1 Tax=Winogradskyella sp. TaxID=1883156 RepID=UPI00385F8622